MSNQTKAVSKFYENLNLLRGYAIFTIVCQHVDTFINIYSPGNRITSWNHPYDIFIMTIGAGGTWFFVFISGFLFYGLFYKRGFDFGIFIKGKLLKVFMPYLIFATSFTIIYYYYYPPDQFSLSGLINQYMYIAYWYIPFIMLIFLMSPVFLQFISINLKLQTVIFLFSLFLSIMVGRHNTNSFLSAIYLAPGYLLGIMCCQYYNQFMSISTNGKFNFFWLSLCLACIISANGNWGTNWSTWEWHPFNPPDFTGIIKCCTCLIFVWFFQYIQSLKLRFINYCLNILSKYSFTIYFFHLFPLLLIKRLSPIDIFVHSNFWMIQIYNFCIGVIICLTTIILFSPIKKLLGKYSRRIIGC